VLALLGFAVATEPFTRNAWRAGTKPFPPAAVHHRPRRPHLEFRHQRANQNQYNHYNYNIP